MLEDVIILSKRVFEIDNGFDWLNVVKIGGR